jgi:hypothetical protein
MALADRITELPDTVRGYPCSVGALIDSLAGDKDELAALQFLLYGRAGLTETTRGYKGRYEREVFEAVTAEGYKVAKNQINEHRGKRCRCYKDAA